MLQNDYISKFNIDINSIFTPEEATKEIADKVFYQLNFDPVFSPKDLETLELQNPAEWNRINSELEETQLRIAMDFSFQARGLLEKDMNKHIGFILELINYIKN